MPATRRRGWVLVVAALMALFTVAPAAAHTSLISTDPADGQTLKKPPATVSLRFAEPLLDAGARMVAKDTAGATIDLGSAQVQGQTLTAQWPATADSGTYTVAYRAVAGDGHPLEGRFSFSIESATRSPEPPAPAESAVTASPEVSASPVAAATEQNSGINPLVWVLAALALLGGGIFIWRSRAD